MVVTALTRPPPDPLCTPKNTPCPPTSVCCFVSTCAIPPPPGDAHVGRWGHGDTTHVGGVSVPPPPPPK